MGITQIVRNFFGLKKLALIIAFFTLTPVTIVASVLTLVSFSNDMNLVSKPEVLAASPSESQKALVYAASTNKNTPSMNSQIISGDARPKIIHDYLNSQNSPLTPFAEKVVEAADKYGLDYRLLAAIAQKESGLCRRIPPDSHNCWGWGIHSKGTLMFDNYDEAIEVVSKGLREKYLDQGYVTPEQIMKKYAHPDSTTWADGVNMYMDQME